MPTCYKRIFLVLLLAFALKGIDLKGQNCSSSLSNLTFTVINGSCTGAPGGWSITVPPSSCPLATVFPWSIFWITPPGCPTPTLVSVPGPTVLTTFITGTCGSSYIALLNQGTLNVGSGAPTSNPIVPPGNFFTPFSNIPPLCNGACNGVVTGIITTANPPCAYTLTPSGTASSVTASGLSNGSAVTFTSLCAGIQTLQIQNNAGCINSFTFAVSQPTALGAITATSNPSCFGGNNGTFSITPSGGTANYTVAFSNAQTFTSSATSTVVATNLSSGAISATITDNNGCTFTTSASITQPTSITIVSTQTNVNCFGVSNGIGSVSVTGGGGTYTYSWAPITGSAAINNSLAAGNQTVFVTDNFSCTVPMTVNITQPSSITLVTSINQITCNAQCNGAATISAIGPTAAVNFTWLAGAGTVISTAATANSLCAGLYTIIARDISTPPTCNTNTTISITQPTTILIGLTSQSISCITSTCSGSATANVSGGNGPPYTYSWSPGALTGSTAVNLCAQNYTLSVGDASSCSSSTTFIIAQPAVISAAITQTNISCNGGTNGAINASPSGGTAPYTFTITSSSGSTVSAPPYLNLGVGTYSLFIRDNSSASCPQISVVTLTAPNSLGAAITQSNITCSGLTNGFLLSNPTGGTGPSYSHTWTTSSGTFFTASINNQAPGSFTYILGDPSNCTFSVVGTLTVPPSLSLTITSVPISCFSATNGILTANVAGGSPGYTFNWLPNNFTGNPNPNLGAGIYTLIVTDSQTCTITQTASISSPSAISISFTTSPTKCVGSSDGSATLIATGGNSPYVYSFNTSPVITNTTGIVSTFSVGSYIASVTDANSCTQSTVINIAAPTVISSSITGVRNSCTGCTGAATVTPAGGTPAYSFVWTNSLGVTVSTLSNPSTLCPGIYSATVFDSNLCASTTTVSVNQVVFSATPGSASVQCFGACNASVVVSPIGGIPPYTYTWTPSAQTTQTATNLCGNTTYTIQVRESSSSGCTSTTFVTITSPSSISVNATTVSPSCFGSLNGAVTTTVSGGTGPYNYLWSPGGQTTTSLSSQPAGTLILNVTDANACTITPQSYTLNQTASITAIFNNTPPTGCTVSNGSICVTPSGGSGGGYTFLWSPGSGTSNCISGLASGVYSVVISDAAACSRTFVNNLNSPSGPTISIVQQSIACFGQSTGAATINTSGTAPFNFTWSPAVAGNTTTATALNSGTYVVSAIDANSCIASQSFAINQASAVTINSIVVNSKCAIGLPTGSISVNPTGGTPAFSYSWTGAPTVTSQNVTGLAPGTYTLRLTDAASCINQYTFNVTAPPAISVTANSTRSVICSGFTNGSITANASGGTPPLSFTWSPLSPFSGSATATIFNLGPGVYSVNAIDGNGCSAASPSTWTLAASTLSTSISQQSASCSNSTNASATITPTGGSPTYSFSWSFGTSTTNVITNLGVGNYVGTVTDLDGCSSQKSFTINPASSFTVSVIGTNPRCNGALNGSITTVPSGGIGPIVYSWQPSGIGQNPTGLGAGGYSLVATDNNSCQAIGLTTLINPLQIQANLANTGTVCFGVCNGTAGVNPINAVGTLSVSWLPSGPSTQTINSLCAGSYTVNVTDGNGCIDNATFSVLSSTPINLNPSIAPPTCGVSNGSITVLTSGGSPGYTYTWSPNVSTGISATGLTAQVYTVVVKDNANCTNTVNIPLSNSNGPVATISSTNNLCFGQCIGGASVGVISGGTAPYKTPVWISPAPSLTANSISNLCTIAGGYSVELEDNLGCKTFTGTNISQTSSITVNAITGLPSCNGVCNGSISLNTSGGVGPYSYSWSPSAPNTSVLTNLCANIYSVLITHNSGSCSSTQTFNIPAQTNLTFTDNVVSNTCFGSCNAVANVSVITTPGIPSPFVFSWSNGQTGTGLLSTSASSLCNGIYSLTATGTNGCFNTHTVNITSPSQLTLTSTSFQPSCGVCNGSIGVNAGGGTGSSYTYSWSNGANTSTLSNLCAGLYLLNVGDAIGCVQTRTVVLNNSNGINTPTISNQNIPCGATCNGAATVLATSPNLPITYNWLSPAVSGSIITGLCSGTYFVQLQDASGCLRTSSTSITAASSISIASFINPPTCGVLTNGTINLTVSGGTPTYSFSWLPSGPSSATNSNVGPGSYTVNVSDTSPGGCVTSSVVNVSSFNAPNLNFLSSNISCFNACTGAATAIVTGSGSPFSYNWSVGGNLNTISNVCKGIITLTVTDSNTCIAVKSVTVTDNPQLQINAPFVAQPSCNQCNGVVTLNAFGGVGPYSYTWINGSTGTVVSNLCAGLYQVNIKDSQNCQVTQNVIVNNSNGITGSTITPQNIPCGGTCSGALTVTAVSPNLPLSYNWVNPAVSGSVISNLCVGNYVVQIQDANGCLLTQSANISAASNISITPLIVPPACGATNGKIQLAVSGGSPSYTFNWLPSAPNTGTLNNIGPGSYTVTVFDSSPGGCQTTTVLTISNTNAPGINFSSLNIDCFNQCTGSATAIVTGTATPFTYNWSAGGNSSTASNLCKGVITLTVTDTKTCIAVKSLTLTDNPQIQISNPVVNQPSCNQCNGAASVVAIGGVLPYTYSWNNGASGNALNGLCAGLYQVLIMDQKNCLQTQNVVINNSNGITGANFNIQNLSCANSCNGSATVTPVGGTSPISYSWINPTLTSSTGIVSNLCQGSYFVQMIDASGCIRTASTNLIANSDMTITASSLPPSCNLSNGIISLSVSGGNAPYTYSWTPAATNTSSLSGLAAGNYTVRVTDANGAGCQKTQIVSLNNLNGPSFTSSKTDVKCFGQCTGSISITPNGTTATTFNWSNGNIGQSITGLCQGLITLTATANGCKTSQTYTISENPKLDFNSNVLKVSCANKCDAQITLLPLGGLLTYSFVSSTSLSANSATALCAGKYTFTITDQAGCSLTDSVRIKSPIPIASVLNATNSSCASVRDASASVVISGGTPVYSVNWSGPSGFNSTQISINNVLSGNYTLSVTDNLGCKKDSLLIIKSNIEVNADAGLDSTFCPSSSVIISGSKSTNAVAYNWYLSSSLTSPIASASSFTITKALQSNTYVLIAQSSFASCSDTDAVFVGVYNEPYLEAGPSFTIPVFSSVTIGGSPTSLGVQSVTWSPTFGLDNPNSYNPLASNTVNVTYTVSASFGNGCIMQDTMEVFVYPEIKVSGGFSPNNDGKNDLWIIDYLEQFPNHEVEIYNRWGDLLFYAKNYNNAPFDGKYKGTNLPVGTYYYIIKLNNPGYPKPYSGPLTIFR